MSADPEAIRHREERPHDVVRARVDAALERRALLELQVRALLRAAGGRELRIMFPMVAEIPHTFKPVVIDFNLERANST